MPTRALAAVIIAALLTGAAAAGLTLGDGEWFQQWFDKGDLAGYYGSAADTDQLSDLGAGIGTQVVEHDGLRFEILDAVSDGQRLMVSARLSLVSPDLLEWLQEGYEVNSFDQIDLLPEQTGSGPMGLGFRIGPWDQEARSGNGQFLVIFDATSHSLSESNLVSFLLRDLYFVKDGRPEQELWPGEWTLTVTPQPTEPLVLEPKRVCQVNGVDWMLDSVTLSPLTLQFSLHCLARERQDIWDPSKGLEIHMKVGTVVDRRGYSQSGGCGGHSVSEQLEFPMPLDLKQLDYLRICGMDIDLEE